MAAASGAEFWRKETILYDAPHPRLHTMARWLRRLPQRRLLDIGCSTGSLRSLLPADYAYYGCDIADYASARLAPDHFVKMDLNEACALSVFGSHHIDVIHLGGVLEYLRDPRLVLRSARQLVAAQSPMVLSLINFEAQRYAHPSGHHPGWIFKPRLEELVAMLGQEGWAVERVLLFLGKRGPRLWWFQFWSKQLGRNNSWVRKQARQFILLARAC